MCPIIKVVVFSSDSPVGQGDGHALEAAVKCALKVMRSSKADFFSFEFSTSSPRARLGDGGVHSWVELEKVLMHAVSLGCISDMCNYKPDINEGIRAGRICPECQEIFASRLGDGLLRDFQAMLQRIRDAAIDSKPGAPFSEFPPRAHFLIAPLE